MKITAELNNLRMSPRKVRLVADAIRGKKAPEAERALKFLGRRAAGPVEKLLKSAVANAKHNFRIDDAPSLVVSEIRVDEGVTLKRRRARAMGRAFPIRKRTSRIMIVLEAAAKESADGRKKPGIVVSEAGGRSSEAAEKARRREAPASEAAKPKIETKPKEVSRRIFRRKAI